MCVGCLPPLVRQTRSLGAHHYCRSLCHRTVVVQAGVLKLRRKYPDSFGFKEGYGLRGGAHCRGNRENSSYGCTYEVGVVQICTRVADDKSVRSGGITGPEQWAVDWTNIILKEKKIGFKRILLARSEQEGYQTVGSIESKSLSELTKYMLHKSNNLYADAIAKTVAAEFYKLPATYHRTVNALRQVLNRYANINLGNTYHKHW